MYCPKCAAPVTDDQKFCRSCGLDLQVISQLLAPESKPDNVTDGKPVKTRRAKIQFQGVITLMSALLIGCLIPISIGLFSSWTGLSQLILVLSGFAGIFLFPGIIMLIYADTLPKTELQVESPRLVPMSGSVPTNQLPPADQDDVVPSVTEHTTDLLKTPAGKKSR